MTDWYVAVSGEQQGPMSAEGVRAKLASGELGSSAHVFSQGMSEWQPIGENEVFADAVPAGTPRPPAPSGSSADVIDFKIFGDGSASTEGGFMGKLMSAGKRVLTGESLFMTVFGNAGGSRQRVAFASPYPGCIIPLDLNQYGGTILCQKQAFLCAAKGVAVGIAFQRKIGAGLFGGEGFMLQKLEGDGLAFVHAGGMVVERELEAGEVMRLDTGCLVAFEQHVGYDITMVKGIKTALFGGDGLFYATMTGPGKVWIQSLPFSRLASRIYAAAPQTGGRRTGEGSILGGIGDLVMGD